MKDKIVVRGARQHNLKGFDLEIPRRTFTVITGPSGSGLNGFSLWSILLAVVGAMLLLWVYRLTTKNRTAL